MDKTIDRLRRYESRNVTFIERDGSWPIVWQRARGVDVWDENGRKYLDLTAAFGVAAAGHANPRVVRAGQRQMAELLHAMGDVHPHARKAELAAKLSELTFERWSGANGKTIFANSGFEAVEGALKTAFLATGRRRVIAFEGGYHGLGYGALTTTYREHFRSPFQRQLSDFATFVEFPTEQDRLASVEKELVALLRQKDVGAILAEPLQARGGIRVPASGFLTMLRSLCDRFGALLIADEIYTGFGRTGRWFACEYGPVVPDIICLGKALTGGFPLSACVGKATIMDAAWPPSNGEAIHTSTFLGHPVGCAMALANIAEIATRKLVERSAQMGIRLLSALTDIRSDCWLISARGVGLMAGIELLDRSRQPATAFTLNLVKKLLHRGFIFLPEGESANVISFTPPLTIGWTRLQVAVEALEKLLRGQ